MNILAIDTCTDIASVTLYKSGEFTSRAMSGVEKTSGHILKLCDEVFKESKTQLKEVDLISYSKGPGSFTGVRMCIGVVQGLSLSMQIPTMGFTTLELIGFRAMQITKSKKIAVALDARMREVYWATYVDGLIDNMKICNPQEVDDLDSSFVGVGSGWKACSEALKIASNISKIDLSIKPESSALIELSLQAMNEGFEGTLDLPQPIYLRNNVAEKSLK
ncbi:tRNA (adenosine(37)-N6)-threonylcarbamoyltransferase complex dimerization subunit type 1 TsaB [Pseudothioglobus sp. nBUS_23]|uniref:tRNA (adenosine(37)-N6)-threonylcarbamoyltransferase complex dimerization subunit type 1 TsaB n=1 Tax=Pseudothioglobus sp. nBUS_23 TaxID=3395318 RepID=UPI003EBBCC75